MKRPAWQFYPICLLVIFVMFHSLTPADPRIRMGFKPFEPEFDIGPAAIWYSVKKWRHILWFGLYYPLVRSVIGGFDARKAFVIAFMTGFLIEFEESFVAGRHGRLTDLLPDLIGIGVGWIIWRYWYRERFHGARAVPMKIDPEA